MDSRHASPNSPDGHYGRLDTEFLSGERNGIAAHDQNGSLRRDVSRPLSGVKSFEDDMDLENGKDENGRDKPLRYNRPLKLNNQAFLSGLAYCLSSCSMILVNKFVLSGYDFSAGISLMLYQNFVSVILVSTLSSFGVVSTEPLTWKLIKVWLPVNIIFVGMLATSMLSLKYINVAMVTVLKNVTNVITAIGEMYLFMKHHDRKVWTALILMIISAISGGITDLSFHAIGYQWQILNCFLTASYSVIFFLCFLFSQQILRSSYASAMYSY